MTKIEKPPATAITEGFEKQTIIEQAHIATPDTAKSTIFDIANGYLGAGFSLVPIKADGSKQPALKSWKGYETQQPTGSELHAWFAGKVRGVAIVGGIVSGGLECIDIDLPELIEEYFRLIKEHAPDLLSRLVIVETPRGGRHLVYRCTEIAGNQKLALREVKLGDISDDEAKRMKAYKRKRDGMWCKVHTLIETRGEGGYFLAPGSPASCHSTGREYCLLQGSFSTVPTITPTERAVLLDCARSLNEHVKDSQQKREPELNNGLKPGADFNLRGNVSDLLDRNGWRKCGGNSIGERWIRPGGDRPSATLFAESRKLFVFSTNAAPLEYDRAYSPFALMTTLEHEGDYHAAAKVLAADGYGQPSKTKDAKKSGEKRKQVGSITFNSSKTGVRATDEDSNQHWICSQLEIEADTRDENSENWGRLLSFPDRDGVIHKWAMPMSLLSGDGREYRERLLELGLVISPGRKARILLESYLNTKPEKKALCVTKQGWHNAAFVLPDETIGENAEPIYLQTVSANHLFRQSGTVEDWRENVGRYCARNSRLVLAVSIAFAAPLLEPLQGESGGWHLTSQSSKGKTTALYVGGSVHGGGGDKGFIRRWRATINGLETVAATHNDSFLCLDEIAECKPDDVNEAAYMLANGQGKARQSRVGALRHTLEWRLVFLSSGELSIADHIAQSGKRVRAGQEVRVINLPADAEKGFGLFEELHGFASADELARYLQRASRDYYGAPIRAFLRRVAGNLEKLKKDYRVFEAELLAEILPKGAASEVSRVAHRFALAAFAGELATNYGITGWQPDEATAALKTLFQTWLDSRGTTGSTDEEGAMRQVRRFIELHGQSRFQRLNGETEKIVNRAGYVEEADDEGLIYYILPEVFRSEVCAGFDQKVVARALIRRGGLRTSHDLRYEKRLPEGKKKVYAVLSSLLE